MAYVRDPAETEALRAAELTRRARAAMNGTVEIVGAGEVRRRVRACLREARTLDVLVERK